MVLTAFLSAAFASGVKSNPHLIWDSLLLRVGWEWCVLLFILRGGLAVLVGALWNFSAVRRSYRGGVYDKLLVWKSLKIAFVRQW